MNALATSLGRLPTIRKRESKKHIKPINVDAAQKFVPAAGPSSSSTLTTPRPTDFLHASSSSSLTPPHSPYYAAEQPQSSSSAAAAPHRSPLRRAFSRTFRFGVGSTSSNSSTNYNSNGGRADSSCRSSTPLQISAPLMEPQLLLSSPDSFDMDGPRTSVALRRRSKTLLSSLPVDDTRSSDIALTRSTRRPASSSSRIRSFWGGDSSSSAELLPAISVTPSMRQSSLRSIRQLHQHAMSSMATPSTPEPSEPCTKPRPPPAPVAAINSRRLLRRASEESFFCRGLGYDGVDASEIPDVPLTAPLPRMAAHRMSNFTNDAHGLFEPEISTNESGRSLFGNVASEGRRSGPPSSLAGLGFTDCSPSAPRPKTKRLSVASQVSDVSSLESFYSSTSSLHSHAATSETTTSSPRSSWPEVPAQWFSSCPPTPPSAIRLRLQFLSLPCKAGHLGTTSPAAIEQSKDTDANSDDDQPFDALFVSSNNSVLDLKEILAERLRSKGYLIFPKELSTSLNLADSLYHLSLTPGKSHKASSSLSSTSPSSALGLAFNEEGRSPIKHLANNLRLLFEEGAQEDDTIVIRYLSHEVSAKFF